MAKYDKMSIDQLSAASAKLKGEIAKLKEERKTIKNAMDYKFQFVKFERMSDSEKEAMKIYVNGFSSQIKSGKVG